MNKKFIATFAAAAMLCCVCNAGVAVADESTAFQTTITQLVNEADNHIDALKKIVNEQDDAELKKAFTKDLKSAEQNKQKIQDARIVIEKFEKDLTAAGDNPDENTLKTLKDEYYAAQSAQNQIFSGDNHTHLVGWSMPYDDPFEGYPDYSRWLKEAMSYGKISDANVEITKLKNTKEKIGTLVKSIKLPSEINPENTDDKCDHEFKGEELQFWYDGAADASNTKYVAAQLDYWRKDVQYIKNRLKDKVAKSVSGLAADMKYNLENKIYHLTSKVEAAMNLHDGEEYLLKESKEYSNLEDAFKHNIMQYNNFGITEDQSSTPAKDGFNYKTYSDLEDKIQKLYGDESYNIPSRFSTIVNNPANADAATRKDYLAFYKKRIEIEKQIDKLYKQKRALGEYPYEDHKPTTDSRTARPGAISYAYLQLKFKKYVQNLLDKGTDLKKWLAENKPAYDAIFTERKKEFGTPNKVSYEQKKSPKYFESFFKQHRYEFIENLVASREYKKYVKNALKDNKTYADMIKDTEDALKGADSDTNNRLYPRIDFIKHLQEYGNDDEVAKILDTDDVALTPEQKSSEALVDDSIPDFKKLSERDKPHFPHSNPTGGSSSVNVGGSAGGTNTAPPVNPDDINSGDDSDDFNIDDLNLDDIDLDDLGLDKLDLDDLGIDDVEAEDFDFSEFDTYLSEISDDDLASLNIDDINF
ncbi:hypothetical protein HMPREF3208_00846 [Gardnerella vaginalis]|uniref:Peptidase n=1 Tax=Gardnerella vaginalis TaxID=2702 RepID=A0A133NV35_GARVA|nr:hypothetical protein [Gardnerella vaginalis]KXA20152.1 hypothetical protein HMPREF3208_00846 [Gardnerella vaginalis]